MRRVKSVTSERKLDRKKLQEKFSDRINTFRVCPNSNGRGNRYIPPTDNTNQNDNGIRPNHVIESMNNLSFNDSIIPLQQSNVYHPNVSQQRRLQEEDTLLYRFLSILPPTAFESLTTHCNTSSNNTGFPMQTVPNSYSESILPGFQDQTINNSVDNINNQLQINFAATNFQTYNRTVPKNTTPHSHHHHGINHYSSDSALLTPNDLLNQFSHSTGHVNDTSVAQHSPSLSATRMGVTPSSSTNSNNAASPLPLDLLNPAEMPSRPSPPLLPGGPEYFQASDDLRMCFRMVDSDDNGFITLEELRIFLENKDKTSFNDDAVLTIMDMFDNNKDNMIDSSEFPDMLVFIRNWDSCFKFLDSDNSGTIDYREMLYAIKYLGFENLSHKFTLMLLKKYDGAGSGLINLDNFILACVTLCRYKKLHQNMEQMFGSTGPKIDLEQFICLFIWPNTSS